MRHDEFIPFGRRVRILAVFDGVLTNLVFCRRVDLGAVDRRLFRPQLV
jgi:hypothetical protein